MENKREAQIVHCWDVTMWHGRHLMLHISIYVLWFNWSDEIMFLTCAREFHETIATNKLRDVRKSATCRRTSNDERVEINGRSRASSMQTRTRELSWMRTLFQLLAVKLIFNSVVLCCAVLRISMCQESVCVFYVFNKAFRKLNVRNVYRNDKMMPTFLWFFFVCVENGDDSVHTTNEFEYNEKMSP